MSGGIQIDEDARRVANLRVLQRLDSSILDIVGSATHCVLYEFNETVQSWEKRDVEGSLFVAKRSPDLPRFKLMIMNRNSRQNLEVPLTATFQMQEREPYLIFRETKTNNDDNNKTIRGIWFHDAEERQKISKLLQRVVQSLSHVVDLEKKDQKNALTSEDAAATLLSPLSLEDKTNSQAQTQNNNGNTNNNNSQNKPLVLDKKSLQLSLMSLLQDERFLDLIHAQYLKVANARANKK